MMADAKLSTFMKISMNSAGPTRPIVVIVRRTDNTVQPLLISESAKWPAAMPDMEFIMNGTAVNDSAVSLTPNVFDK